MNKLFVDSLKKEIFSLKGFFTTIIVPIFILLLIINFYRFQSLHSNEFKIGILNLDKQSVSQELISRLSDIDGLKVIEIRNLPMGKLNMFLGRYDNIYIIENDFSKKVQNGNYENVISNYNYLSSNDAGIVNDQITIEVVRIFMYYDSLAKVKEINPTLNETIFKENFFYELNNRKLLDLKIIADGKEIIENSNIDYSYILYKIFWIVLALYFIMKFGEEIFFLKYRKILERIKISGYNVYRYLISKILLVFIKIEFSLITVSFFLFPKFQTAENYFFDFFLRFNLILCLFVVTFTVASFISKTKNEYLFLSQILSIVLMVIGVKMFIYI